MNSQGNYVEFQDGVEVPYSHRPLRDLVNKSYQLPAPESSSKRKADAQPDGEPASKAAKSSQEDGDVHKMSRHGGGLLAAVEALEEEMNEPSNAPSPPDGMVDAPTPDGTAGREGEETMIPRAAGDPDEHGVRIISKRPNRADPVPNNRIVVPNAFEWEEHEIGFRDSTNKITAAKKNLKRIRGKYTDGPNTNFLHIDRRVSAYDSTEMEEDDFDQELVAKFKLHPKLGIVLPTSLNESPRDDNDYLQKMATDPDQFTSPVVDHTPLIFQGPNGERIVTSRSYDYNVPKRMLWDCNRKRELGRLLRQSLTDMDIDPSEIDPTTEDLAEYRRKTVIEMGMDPDQVFIPTPPTAGSAAAGLLPETKEQEIAEDDNEEQLRESVETLLHAAAAADRAEEEARLSLSPTTERKKASRPYDAIRDVFTESAPPPPPVASYHPHGLASTAAPPLPTGNPFNPPFVPHHAPLNSASETSGLHVLADIATGSQDGAAAVMMNNVAPPPVPLHPDEFHGRPHAVYSAGAPGGYYTVTQGEAPMMAQGEIPMPDHTASYGHPAHYPPPPPPQLQSEYPPPPPAYGQPLEPQQPSPYHTPRLIQAPIDPSLVNEYPPPPPTYGHPLDQQHVNQQGPANLGPLPTDPALANNFLRTALNPRPSEYGQGPAGAEYAQHGGPAPHHHEQAPPAPSMTRTPFTSTAGTNSLPALRPVRSMMGEGGNPPPTEPGVGQLPPAMAGGNPSPFYPSAPPRPFHHAYPPQEPVGVMHPLPPPPPQSAPGPPSQHFAGPPPPPPPMSGQPFQMGPAAPHYHGGPGQGAPPPLPPAQPSPRSRPGSSSSVPANSSAKYRELMPAPVPPHRAGQQSNGQGLKTITWDYREQLKDTAAPEAPPSHGPTTIRGWNHVKKPRVPASKAGEEGN